MRAHYASRLRVWRDICIVVGGGVGAVYFWSSSSFHWLGIALLVLSSALTLELIAAFVVIPIWVFRRNPKLRDEFSFRISQEGVHYDTLHIGTQLQWNLFTQTLVDSYSYLLYWESRAFVLIPKRVFQSAEQQRTFEELLAEYVPKTAKKQIR